MRQEINDTPTTLSTEDEIRRLESQQEAIKRRIEHYRLLELRKKRDSLIAMVGKTFKRHLGGGLWEYVIICNPPTELVIDRSVHINNYQLPALHFYYNPNHIVGYEREERSHEHPPIWFESVFTGVLPEPYKNGYAIREVFYEEIPNEEFESARIKRLDEIFLALEASNGI